MQGQLVVFEVKQGYWKQVGKYILEVQVSVYGVYVIGWWLVQVAVYRRFRFFQILQFIIYIVSMVYIASCVLRGESRWVFFRDWGRCFVVFFQLVVWFFVCLSGQCLGSSRVYCSFRGGYLYRGYGFGSFSYYFYSRVGRCR